MYQIFLNLHSKSSFHRVLEDDAYKKENKLISLKKDNKIKKVVMCSGKIYYDLIEKRKIKKDDVVFIIRTTLSISSKNFS